VALLGLDHSSKTPPYEQVRRQLVELIDAGVMRPDERLPPVRQLAAELRLAVNTVAKAYRELELAGFVQTRGRNGTFVAGEMTERRRLAFAVARSFTRQMRDLGIGDAEMLAILRREVEAGDESSI
jgi:DNA-binding transcriptional regulator YhcF (GntR family)